MARGNSTAQSSATTAQSNSSNQLGSAGQISSLLVPTLENQIANPQGINPTDMAALRTSNMQGAGGSEAAAVGQGALQAARTRNAGAAPSAIASGIRGAGENLSQANLDTNLANQKTKLAQQTSAENGLGSLYGTTLNAGNTALSDVAPLVNANTNAINSSYDWASSLLDPALSAGATVGAAALKNCWIAEAIYGADDPRTHLLRFWLNGPFAKSLTGAAVMAVYRAVGRPVAWMTSRSALVRTALTPLFDAALQRACE
jgi:hypothetical protein